MTVQSVELTRLAEWKSAALSDLNQRVRATNEVYVDLKDRCKVLREELDALEKQQAAVASRIDAARRGCLDPSIIPRMVVLSGESHFFSKLLACTADCDISIECPDRVLKYPSTVLKHVAPFFASIETHQYKKLVFDFSSKCVDVVIKFLAVEQAIVGPLPFLLECYQLLHFLGENRAAEECLTTIQTTIGNDLEALFALYTLWIKPDENPAYIVGYFGLLIHIVGNNQPMLKTVSDETAAGLFAFASKYIEHNVAMKIYVALACRHGVGTEVELERSYNLLRDVALSGHALGQTLWAEFYHFGIHVPQNRQKAFNLVTAAANEGTPLARAHLASYYHHGWVVEADLDAAHQLYGQSANAGCSLAEAFLGRILEMRAYKEDRENNLRSAFGWYTSSANKNDPEGQLYLGLFYRNAIFIPRDHRKAFELFSASAKQGNGLAQAMASAYHTRGVVVPKDSQKGRELFEKSIASLNLSGA